MVPAEDRSASRTDTDLYVQMVSISSSDCKKLQIRGDYTKNPVATDDH